MDMLGKAQEAVRRFEEAGDLRSAAEHRLTAVMYALVALAAERKFEALRKSDQQLLAEVNALLAEERKVEALRKEHAELSLARRAGLAQEMLDLEGEGAVPAQAVSA